MLAARADSFARDTPGIARCELLPQVPQITGDDIRNERFAAGAVLAGLAGPDDAGPPTAEAAAALSFTKHGGYIDVIVRHPVADPRLYREDFQAHGLRATPWAPGPPPGPPGPRSALDSPG